MDERPGACEFRRGCTSETGSFSSSGNPSDEERKMIFDRSFVLALSLFCRFLVLFLYVFFLSAALQDDGGKRKDYYASLPANAFDGFPQFTGDLYRVEPWPSTAVAMRPHRPFRQLLETKE